MTAPLRRIVVTDANVLINLMHVARLDLCASLPGYEFVVPDHVREEIQDSHQRSVLDDALGRGRLRLEAITDLGSIALFAELTVYLGRGEAACLTLAVERGWVVASDEKRRFRREAENRIGKERIIGIKELYLLAIGAGMLNIDQADRDKAMLEQRRFRMGFTSFRDLLPQEGAGKEQHT